uniref:Ig-like domain-containing protein n=2 Tax=Zoogloea TaxID=349 RepID=UPI002FDF5167
PQTNTAGTYGRFSINAAGAWTYTTLSALDTLDAGQVVTDVFTVTTSDGGSATVTITITGTNDVASLSSGSASLTETDAVQNTGGTLTLTDADTTAATVAPQTNTAGTYGRFSINAAGAWTYTTLSALDTLDAGQVVSDVFTVTTSDGGSATVTITITGTNDIASLSSGSASLTETDAVQNTSGTLTLTDADTTDATVVAQTNTAGTYGRFSVDATGIWTYTTSSALNQLNAGQVVSDVFTVATSDGGSATVTVSITGTNDAPTAVADTASTSEDTPISIDATANDIDLEGNVLTVLSVTQGAHGSVSVVGGAILYTPDANFHGADSFSYLVSDGQGGGATATVSVTVTPVNDLPQATDDMASVAEDTPLTGSVAGNDSPSGDGGNVWSLVDGPGHGSLVLAGDGSFRYTPDPDFHGTDSFTYALTDADGERVTAVATIVVTPVNDAPVMAGGASVALNIAENTSLVTTLGATDVDRPAQALAYSIVGGADQALFSVDALTGELRFIAAPDHDAPADADRDNLYELVVQVSDGLATASQTLSITVDNRNEMPQGSDGRIGMAEDGQHRFTLADFGFRDDLDKPANGLAAVQIVALPGQGVLQLAGQAVGAGEWVAASQIAAGQLVFQPAPDANGSDYAALVFRVRDDGGLADGGIDTEAGTHTLRIDVAAVNDAPSISRVAFELPAGTSVVLGAAAVAVSDVDSALASLSYTVDAASAGHFEFLGSPGQVIAVFSQADLVAGRVVFVHDAANVAPVVVLHASDGQAGSDPVTATITLQVSAPATPTGPAVTPPTSPVTVVTPVVTKPVDAEKPTKSPATVSRSAAPEAAAATPASPGVEPGVLGQDAAGNADTGSASRNRSQLVSGALRLDREPIRLTLGGGLDGPLMDFMLRSDSLGATTSSSASLRVAEGNLKDSLQDKDGEVDVRVVLQAIELTGVALSVGAVWWATRAGALVASLLVSVPAWRSFDPLMVLGPEDEDDRDWAGVMDDRAVQDEMGIADVFDAKSGEVRS